MLGAWAGFDLVYVPPLGAIMFVLFAIPAGIGRSLAAFEGLLIGTGGVMFEVIALANWSCAQANARAAEGCTPPDLTARLVVGCALAVAGGALTIRTVLRARGITVDPT